MPRDGYLSADGPVLSLGLTKDELLQCAYRPLWVWLRGSLLTAYWLAWATMLGTAVFIIKEAPRCDSPPPLQWWQRSPMYQVLVQSFSDSGHPPHGLGDIAGMEARLGYIEQLGVRTVCLSPIFNSSLEDPETITNFKAIASHFGTLKDFNSLIETLKKKDMKLLMDWVPNHSSVQHVWFQKSLAREHPYTDYYVWADAAPAVDAKGNPMPPNNWKSVYGGSAWQWSTRRKQFYLHQFLTNQPDLNYRCPELLQEMKDALQFWLELGVDGFRMSAVARLVEDAELRDETPNVSRTFNLPESLIVLSEFRAVVDNRSMETPKVLLAEARLSADALAQYYGNTSRPLAHLVLSTEFVSHLSQNMTANDMYKMIHMRLTNLPDGAWPHWMMGNQDARRVASRLGPELADAIAMVTLLLPGTPLTYYGDELGMEDVVVERETSKDPLAVLTGPVTYHSIVRDPERSPMQWSAGEQAGFTTSNHTWLPLSENYERLNVEVEERADWSHVKMYRALVEARHSEAVMVGGLEMKVLNDDVLAYTRIKKGSPGFLVAVNFANTTVTVDLTALKYIPEKSYVHAFSTNLEDSEYKIRSKISNADVILPSKGGIVLIFVPHFPVHDSGSAH